MLTIREVRGLVSNLTMAQFERELGPFALIQKPASMMAPAGTQVMGLPVNARATMIARPEKLTADVLAMLFQFDDLIIATLPPMSGSAELTVGRAPDCDVVIDEPSVSKLHAVVRWNDTRKVCTLEDKGSTNGTMLNGSIRIRRAVLLRDGDILSFGEVSFWYLLARTLFERLKAGSGAVKLRSHSG
ncbi:MAG: FHA domain-containing protein [Myxococcaceae bacterium]|nr:FHA domain-containing protein [Myxococcaceae bacterium]